MLTQIRLKELLDYDPETGVFTWKASRGVKAGSEAGCVIKGYVCVMVDGKVYKAHRLAWLYVHGSFPNNDVHHVNGITNDNRIENLRDVTHRENQQNQIKHRDGKLVGATFNKAMQKWRAAIRSNGKLRHLGYFSTESDAHQAYLEACTAL